MKLLYSLSILLVLTAVVPIKSANAMLLLTLVQPQRAMTANPTKVNEERAIYSLTFTSTWSESTHPGWPAGAHFSPLIGATHNLSTTFWVSGTLASPGIEQMAERGGTTLLRQEIGNAGSHVLETISGPGLGTSPATVTISQVTVSREHPLVTLVTMIAPSPDWFVGVHDLSLLDEEGRWQDSLTVTLYPYDAGTDNGSEYTSSDAEATPHQPITTLRGQSPFSSEPIGSFHFQRIWVNYVPLIAK